MNKLFSNIIIRKISLFFFPSLSHSSLLPDILVNKFHYFLLLHLSLPFKHHML